MNTTKKLNKKRSGPKANYFVKPLSDEEKFWTNKLKAIIYTRVSTDGQVTQWHGLESQETICKERCLRQSWLEIEVVKVFREEGVSGKLMDRKAMSEAMAFLKQENKKYTKIHYFIVTDADRIARPDDIAQAFTLEQDIEALGVKIITVNNKRDTETDEGKFLHTIQYAIAGLERRKILRRTMNGKLSSLKNGWRPFGNPPVGYLRERNKDCKGYIDRIDMVKWPLIREGLELYAYGSEYTKSQLHQFRSEKWLLTSTSKGKLYISFIEKVFAVYRLYFYAGYIYYPERGIDTPILWKQDALISLDVVERILKKEMDRSRIKRKKSPNFNTDLQAHPLKGFIACTECGRKLGCYASKWNGGVYHYYTCGNKYCNSRFTIRKEEMEHEFEQFINQMKVPKKHLSIFKSQIMKEWEESKKNKENRLPQIQWKLLSMQDRMKKIEEKLLVINHEWLIKKLEDERTQLEILHDDLKSKIKQQKNNEENLKKTLSQADFIFTEPVEVRKKSRYEIRQLLFRVWFSGNLHYQKNQWYRTNETTGLHYPFSSIWGLNSRASARGGINSNQKDGFKNQFKHFLTAILAQSEHINAIYQLNRISSI